jgi:hypothetical protein
MTTSNKFTIGFLIGMLFEYTLRVKIDFISVSILILLIIIALIEIYKSK